VPDRPAALLVDADGFVWRDYGDGHVSMCPQTPDNEPLPEPIARYLPVDVSWLADLAACVYYVDEIANARQDDDLRGIAAKGLRALDVLGGVGS
jgi:hypothetical protein